MRFEVYVVSDLLSLGGKRPSVHIMIFGCLAFLGPSVLGALVPAYAGFTGLMSVVSAMCMVLVNPGQSLPRQLTHAAVTTACGALAAAASVMLVITPDVTMFVYVGLVFGFGAIAASLNPALAGAGALLPILGYFMLSSQPFTVSASISTAIALVCGWAWTALMLTGSYLTSNHSADAASQCARQALAPVVDVLAADKDAATSDRDFSQARRSFTSAYNEALERTQSGRGGEQRRARVYADLAHLGQVANLLFQLRVHWTLRGHVGDATREALGALAELLRNAPDGLADVHAARSVAAQLNGAASRCDYTDERGLIEKLAHTLLSNPRHQVQQVPPLQLGPPDGWYINTHLPRTTVQHAVRYIVGGLVSVAVYEIVGTADSLWLLLTVAVVMKSTLGAIFQRFSQRVVGTVIGAILGIGFALALDAAPLWVTLLVPAIVMGVGLSFMSINYFYWVICLTPIIVFITVPGQLSWETPGSRILYTIVGAGLCLALGMFLLPSRGRVLIPVALTNVAQQLVGLAQWERSDAPTQESWVTVRARSATALAHASETTAMCRREPFANIALCDRADWAITCASITRDDLAGYPDSPKDAQAARENADTVIDRQLNALTRPPWSVPNQSDDGKPASARTVIVGNLATAYGRVQAALDEEPASAGRRRDQN